MRARVYLSILAFLLPFGSPALAQGEQSCDTNELLDAYRHMIEVERAYQDAVRKYCGPDHPNPSFAELWASVARPNDECKSKVPDVSSVSATEERLRTCAETDSAVAAYLYGERIVMTRLYYSREAAKNPESERVRRDLEHSGKVTLPRTSDIAAEALGYLQKAYALDPKLAPAAEHSGDLLVSGDVGTGRRFEALDWYYRAATAYDGWQMPQDEKRQHTTRILEKMVGIDRENPLTKKLEQSLYK